MVAIPTVRVVKGDEVMVVNAGSEDLKALKKRGFKEEGEKAEPKEEEKKAPKKGNTFV
tara:strand:+ start:829 stop:1002 length:174 start_codon:yes stop_codon:yes gene_type:complete